MHHNDSVMLARKQISSKRTHGGSFRFMTKSLKEKKAMDRHTSGELFFYESYPLDSYEEYVDDRQSKLQRRATDGGHDTFTRERYWIY